MSAKNNRRDLDDPTSLLVPPTFTAPKSTTTATATATTTQTSMLSSPTFSVSSTSTTCATPTCYPSSRVCPPCKDGFVCSLSVIDTSCQCPIARCVKPGFDTGTDPTEGMPDASSRSKSSVLAPLLGGIAGLIIAVFVALLLVRKHRNQRKRSDRALLGPEGGADGHFDVFSSDNDKHHRLPPNEVSSRNSLIQIAYVPKINDSRSIQLPELTAQLGGGPQASFMQSVMDDNRNKHDSVASSCSTTILDEAVIMAVTTKATPQLLRLNNIKANNSEMIQKSNTLHSSNSIKRTQSQRRQAEAKLTTSQRRRNAVNPSVEPNCQENIISQDDEEEVLYTPAVMITGPSARSSAHSATSIDPRPLVPSLVLEPRPLNKNYGTKRSTTVVMREHEELESSSAMSDSLVRAPTSSSVVGSQLFVSKTLESSASPEVNSTAESALSTASQPVSISPSSDAERLCPQVASDGTDTSQNKHRNSSSTTSTASDARSTMTRGEGEEIMIFWDGNRRDSKTNVSSSPNQ